MEKNKEEIKEMLMVKMGQFLQNPPSLEDGSENLLDSCSIYCRFYDERITESTVQEVIFQAGQECKTLIDDLVKNSIETFKSLSYRPEIPDLMKIQCPKCGKLSRVMGQYEVGCVLDGIALDLWDYVPVDQDVYDYNSDVRVPEYYCSNCGTMFYESEVSKMVDEYEMKYNRRVETDIDIFEDFWDSNLQRSGFLSNI